MMQSLTTQKTLDIGRELVKTGLDDLVDGGFWIWELNTDIEFYSPKFIHTLGFKDESDFPPTPNSWIKAINITDGKIAMNNYKLALDNKDDSKYKQLVTYTKKDKTTITFICSGKLLKVKGKYKYLIGTHKIQK